MLKQYKEVLQHPLAQARPSLSLVNLRKSSMKRDRLLNLIGLHGVSKHFGTEERLQKAMLVKCTRYPSSPLGYAESLSDYGYKDLQGK